MVRGPVPLVFRLRVPVWQVDLDAFGELRSSSLLRCLQETATRASSHAGFDAAFYERAGTMWLVRRTALSMPTAARYGDDLEVTTWIADFRRVRSRRDSEIRADGRLVALAQTDWVYVDRASSQPRRVSPEMAPAFMPEGSETLARTPLFTPNPPHEAAHSTRRVELHELDALRHVNNANYVHYVEQAALDAVATAGWPLQRQLEVGGRLRAVAHDLEYLDAALYGETLTIVTWLASVTTAAVERYTLITRAGSPRPLLRAISRYAWITERGDPAAMPGDLCAALSLPRP